MITHSKKRPICKDFVMNLISLKITENLRYHLVLVLFCFASIAQPLFAQQEDVNFDAIPTATDTPEQKAALKEAINVYKRGDFLRSSLSLYEIIREKEMASNPM